MLDPEPDPERPPMYVCDGCGNLFSDEYDDLPSYSELWDHVRDEHDGLTSFTRIDDVSEGTGRETTEPE